MWTPATRGRMAEIEKKTKRYPTDLTDEEWARIEPFLPGAAKSGRPARTDLREVLNAIRYLARSGGGWRMLPKDFPPWPTVYWWFRRFVRRFLFQTIHDVALMLDRERVGREASPTGGVIDSQSVKAPEAKTRGYDAGKKIVGRKRHIAVDTDGRLLMVNLTTADISDSAGAQMILDSVRKRWPWLKHLFADSAYDRTKLMDKAAFLDFTIEIIKRSDTAQGFEVLPRRWVVERTFGWMTRWRRSRIAAGYLVRNCCAGSLIGPPGYIASSQNFDYGRRTCSISIASSKTAAPRCARIRAIRRPARCWRGPIRTLPRSSPQSESRRGLASPRSISPTR
jgi:putative transposase